MTFGSIKARVQRLLIDLPPNVQLEVPNLINEAVRSMQRRYNFRAMESVQTFNTVLGVTLLGSILNFKEYRDEGPYLFEQYSRAKRLLTALDTDTPVATMSDSLRPDYPQFIQNIVNKTTGAYEFSVAPYPNQLSDWGDGAYRVVIPYYEFTPKLALDNDQNWFTENADDYIVKKAAADGFGWDWDYDSMALWLQRAEDAFTELKQTDKKQRLATVNAFVPMWEGANQPKVRR
jgi:hypothetical protein